MRRTMTGLAAMSAAMAAPAMAAEVAPGPATFLGGVLADAGDADALNRRCDTILAEVTRRQKQLEAEKGPATLASLQRFDDLSHVLAGGGGEFTLYRQVMGDAARRDAGGACEVRLSQAGNALSLSRPIYDRFNAIPQKGLDAATKLYLTRTLQGFERSGVALPQQQREEARKLSDRISEIGTAFEKAIADGHRTVTATPEELAGLPADFIAGHRPGADGRITLSTDYTDIVPVMGYARSEDLKKRLYEANVTRAYPENDARLRELLNLRQQLATLLGRPNHAALALEDKMLNTPAKVEGLLSEMAAAARPVGLRDYDRKLKLWAADHPGATAYGAWNNNYLTNQVAKADYAFDRSALRPYFAYNRVRDGILALTQELFGVTIRPWKTPVWDKDVEAYEMVEKGQVIGRFYFDAHPRPGKYEHANAVPLRPGIKGAGIKGVSVPVGALVMNVSTGGANGGLMEHYDVETFLHEFGHMLHYIFGGQAARWTGQSGVSTEWDFVEAPSQMLEEWVYDYDTLKRFATNDAGQAIPRDLVEKMNRARYFDLGMQDMRQLGFSNISLGLHKGPAPADLGAATRKLDGAYAILPVPEFSQFQDSFGHLISYSAVYYTYRWSKVIALDLFSQFAKNGLHDRATAMRYRNLVLAPGGSRPAADLVQSFLGRPISLDAYKAELAKDN